MLKMWTNNLKNIHPRMQRAYVHHKRFISTAQYAQGQQQALTTKSNPSEIKASTPPKENVVVASNYLAPHSKKTSLNTETISFDDIPGPISLRLISKFWGMVPIMGTEITVSVVQYLLSGGKFFGGILSWGGNAPFFKKFFDVYGPVVRLHGAFGSDVVLLSRPEHASAVFQNEGPYPIRSCLDSVEKYRLQCRNYKQAGPFLTYGPDWEKLRKSIEVPLQAVVAEQQGNIDKINSDFVERMLIIRNKQEEMPENFKVEIYKWVLECLCTVTLNRKLGFLDTCGISPSSDPGRLLDGLFGATAAIRKLEYGFHLWKFIETPAWKSLVKNCDMIDSVLSKYVEKAKEILQEKKAKNVTLEKPTLIEHLLLKENIIGEDVMTVLLDMFLIGANATAHSVAFFFYHLARNPRCQIKLHDELRNYTGEVVYSIFIPSTLTWETPSPHQYHIQTDEGPERYFRYQTDSGQYRKEKRLEDGTVVGTYAWIDADGMLRQRDYIADNEGYRILKTKNIFVGRNINVGDAIKSAKKYPASAGTLVRTNQRPVITVPYNTPLREQEYNSVSFIPSSTPSTIPSSSYIPYVPSTTPSDSYIPSSTPSPILSPSSYSPSQSYIPSTTPTTVPSSSYIPTSLSTTPSPYLDLDLSVKSISPSPYSVLTSTEAPVVEITPNSFARTAYGYVPLNFSYFNGNHLQSTPVPPSLTTEPPYYPSTPSPIAVTTQRPIYPPISPTYSPADFGVSQEVDPNSLEYNPYVRQVKDTYRFQNGPTYPLDKNGRPFVGSDSRYNTYDGVSVTNDGFRYYIPRAYHEEQTEPGDKRSGSFGYIDPFGIRRVIYYNTAPGTGFQHRKNNRYVGFNAAPYDPRPY